MHNSSDSDGTHPLDRIAFALERIAVSFEKLANPPIVANFQAVSKECLPGSVTYKHDVIA